MPDPTPLPGFIVEVNVTGHTVSVTEPIWFQPPTIPDDEWIDEDDDHGDGDPDDEEEIEDDEGQDDESPVEDGETTSVDHDRLAVLPPVGTGRRPHTDDELNPPAVYARIRNTHLYHTLLDSWSLPHDTKLYLRPDSSAPLLMRKIPSFEVAARPFRLIVPDLVLTVPLYPPSPRCPPFHVYLLDPASHTILVDESGDRMPLREGRVHPHMSGVSSHNTGSICMGNLSATITSLYEVADLPAILTFLMFGLTHYNPDSPYWRPSDNVPNYHCSKCRTDFATLRPIQARPLEGRDYTLCATCELELAKAPSLAHFLGMVCTHCSSAVPERQSHYLVTDPTPGHPSVRNRLCARCFDEHEARRCRCPGCSNLTDTAHHERCFDHYPILVGTTRRLNNSPTTHMLISREDRCEWAPVPINALRCQICSLVYAPTRPGQRACLGCLAQCPACHTPNPTYIPPTRPSDPPRCTACTLAQTNEFVVTSRRWVTAHTNFVTTATGSVHTCDTCHQRFVPRPSTLQDPAFHFGRSTCDTCLTGLMWCRVCAHLHPKPLRHLTLHCDGAHVCDACVPHAASPIEHPDYARPHTFGVRRCTACQQHYYTNLLSFNSLPWRSDTPVDVCDYCVSHLRFTRCAADNTHYICDLDDTVEIPQRGRACRACADAHCFTCSRCGLLRHNSNRHSRSSVCTSCI